MPFSTNCLCEEDSSPVKPSVSLILCMSNELFVLPKSHKPPLILYVVSLLMELSAKKQSAVLPAVCTRKGATRGRTSNLVYLTDSLVCCLAALGSAELLVKSFLLLQWRMSV